MFMVLSYGHIIYIQRTAKIPVASQILHVVIDLFSRNTSVARQMGTLGRQGRSVWRGFESRSVPFAFTGIACSSWYYIQ